MRSTRSANGTAEMRQDTEKRRLRSKAPAKASLFNYEEDPSTIDADQQLTLQAHTTPGGKLLTLELPRETLPMALAITELPDVQRPRTLRRSRPKPKTKPKTVHSANSTDPLNDEMYELYHRRMEKEEKKMLNRDRESFCAEADKLKSQLEALAQNDWTKTLPQITYIRDVRDFKELQEKRQWTITSIHVLLSKFEDWRRREDRVLGRVRSHRVDNPPIQDAIDFRFYTQLNRFDYVGDSDTDDDENTMTVQQIRHSRKIKRSNTFGPVIRINLNGGKSLVAQPFERTKVEHSPDS